MASAHEHVTTRRAEAGPPAVGGHGRLLPRRGEAEHVRAEGEARGDRWHRLAHRRPHPSAQRPRPRDRPHRLACPRRPAEMPCRAMESTSSHARLPTGSQPLARRRQRGPRRPAPRPAAPSDPRRGVGAREAVGHRGERHRRVEHAAPTATRTARRPSTVPSPSSPEPSMHRDRRDEQRAHELEPHRALGVGLLGATDEGREVGDARGRRRGRSRSPGSARAHRFRRRKGAAPPTCSSTEARSSGRMRRGIAVRKS